MDRDKYLVQLAAFKVFLEDLGVYCDGLFNRDRDRYRFYIYEKRKKLIIGTLEITSTASYYSCYGKPYTNKEIIDLLQKLFDLSLKIEYRSDEPFEDTRGWYL